MNPNHMLTHETNSTNQELLILRIMRIFIKGRLRLGKDIIFLGKRNHKGHPQDLAEQNIHLMSPYFIKQGPNFIMLDPFFTLNIVKTNKG